MKYIVPREAQSGILVLDSEDLAIDITCHLRAIEFDESVDLIDIGTFCDASATANGNVSRAATLEFRQSFGDGVETGAYEDMVPLVGKGEVKVKLTPWQTDSVEITFDTEFSYIPLGRYAANEAILPDMDMAVRSLVVTPKTP